MEVTYTGVSPNKLHDELILAGINPNPFNNIGNEVSFIVPQGITKAQIDAIVAVHDPTPLSPSPTQDDYLIDLDYRLSLIELGL